jgi:hypothetical protein
MNGESLGRESVVGRLVGESVARISDLRFEI